MRLGKIVAVGVAEDAIESQTPAEEPAGRQPVTTEAASPASSASSATVSAPTGPSAER